LISLVQTRFASPAENLAADEALLQICDDGDHAGFLRFWESTVHFVVLGYGKALEREAYREECARLRITILRRCSGGGTVLQGPGCFNYTLVLPFDVASELETITGANRYIMERVRATIAAAHGGTIELRGCTDLVHDGRKFCGNAQRRKRRALLFHGSFLLDFDLPLITRTLRMPEQQPEYRAHRAHEAFLKNLPLNRDRLRERFMADWNAKEAEDPAELVSLTADLASQKYSTPDWNERH
jgi:lipoate---protein ligase